MCPRPPITPAVDLAGWLLDALPRRPQLQVLGIGGVQGSGKSTLADAVLRQAHACGMRAATLSLDDLYYPAVRRRQLAARIHPLLVTRGPPGSHDLALGHRVLDALHAGQPCALPRFDKLRDEPLPAARWPQVGTPLDLLVLEGWMLGVPAQAQAALREPVNALEREADADGRWRQWCNDRLRDDYPPLWQRIDRLCWLQPPDWEVVLGWRLQQEQELLARADGSATGMDIAAMRHFIAHFERVSRHALGCMPARADHLVTLDAQRQVCALHSRADGLTAPRR